jgi:NAD(P)-dependent dehydrogenase (short-subunit alcohol dehydrogenase family)
MVWRVWGWRGWAGITKDGLVMMMKPEAWQAVIDLNLSGVFYASKAAAGRYTSH